MRPVVVVVSSLSVSHKHTIHTHTHTTYVIYAQDQRKVKDSRLRPAHVNYLRLARLYAAGGVWAETSSNHTNDLACVKPKLTSDDSTEGGRSLVLVLHLTTH